MVGPRATDEEVLSRVADFYARIGDNDKSLKVFVKGRDSKDVIEKELKKYKKDFSLDTFGVVAP